MYQRLEKRALVQFDLEPGDKDFNDFMIKFSFYEKAQFDVKGFLDIIKAENKEEIQVNQPQVDSGQKSSKITKHLVLEPREIPELTEAFEKWQSESKYKVAGHRWHIELQTKLLSLKSVNFIQYVEVNGDQELIRG